VKVCQKSWVCLSFCNSETTQMPTHIFLCRHLEYMTHFFKVFLNLQQWVNLLGLGIANWMSLRGFLFQINHF
jgi:hypothetical protein